jgi:hypothetical protein
MGVYKEVLGNINVRYVIVPTLHSEFFMCVFLPATRLITPLNAGLLKMTLFVNGGIFLSHINVSISRIFNQNLIQK